VAIGRGATATPGGKVPAPTPSPAAPSQHQGSFSFGSYGRMIAGTDARGGPGRDADIVAHGSRLDESNYVELELRRDDAWEATGAKTRLVATIAFAHPVFHYDGNFDAHLAARNLYLEERDLGLEGLAVWAGSRMLRGDDIYLLDWWPLDNLNTVGAGVGYHRDLGAQPPDPGAADQARRAGRPGFGWIDVHVHGGLSRPDSPFYLQTVDRPAPLDQIGSVTVTTLDRQRFIGSVRAEYGHRLGERAGIKGVVYGESHQLPAGERETAIPREFEALPSDDGFVIGGQLGVWTGERGTHLNVYARYATGLAAYGQVATPGQLTFEDTTSGASEVLVAAGANAEAGPVGILLGTYYRSFRDASPSLDFDDVDEGIVAVRPAVFFGELGGLAVEGSLQMAQHGVVSDDPDDPAAPPEGPRTASMWRLGVVPFLSPAGRGNFSRPQFRFIYAASFRDDVARQLYAEDDVFGLREVEHFVGVGAEWWFNSTTYDR
jgi:maltoporin